MTTNESFYQAAIMVSLAVSAGAIVCVAYHLGRIDDSLKNCYQELKGLREDLSKIKGLEKKTEG